MRPSLSGTCARAGRRLWAPLFGLSIIATALLMFTSPSARAADFYQNKTLTLIVGYAPGGGVDATARVIARHLVRFIPGQPGIVVQNMEGAAGLTSLNYLDRRVAPDGLTIAIPGRSWYIEGMIGRPGVAFDPVKLTYLGSPGAVTSSAYLRSALGIKTFADLMASPRPVIFGALGATTPTAMVPTLLAANGAPIKVVLGYVSTARVLLALEQGEVDGTFTVGNALLTRADLMGKVVPIVQRGAEHGDLPSVRDLIRPEHRPVLDLVTAPDSIGVPLIGPAGMPATATDMLRQAFTAMAQDKDYQADALKVELPVDNPIGGAELAMKIKTLAASTTPAVAAAFRRLAGGK